METSHTDRHVWAFDQRIADGLEYLTNSGIPRVHSLGLAYG
jgi:hypothetical protein